MTVFVLVLLSDVLGVKVFLLTPTASGGDGDGPRFYETLPPSSPRFRDIALKTPDEFPLFYYESRKRKPKTRLIYEDRCDERLKN